MNKRHQLVYIVLTARTMIGTFLIDLHRALELLRNKIMIPHLDRVKNQNQKSTDSGPYRDISRARSHRSACDFVPTCRCAYVCIRMYYNIASQFVVDHSISVQVHQVNYTRGPRKLYIIIAAGAGAPISALSRYTAEMLNIRVVTLMR